MPWRRRQGLTILPPLLRLCGGSTATRRRRVAVVTGWRGHHPGSHRIKVDVSHQLAQVTIALTRVWTYAFPATDALPFDTGGYSIEYSQSIPGA